MDARTLPHRLARSRWLGLAIGVVVLVAWAAFLWGQLADLQTYHWQITPIALAVGVFWGAIYFGGLALCWALLLQRIGGTKAGISIVTAMRVWLYSMITRYVPGNVWHVLSRVALAGQLRMAASQVLTSASVEQVLVLLGSLALFGLTLPFWSITSTTQVWLLLLLPVGLLLLHPRVFGRVLDWTAVRLRRPELAWHYNYREILILTLAYAGATVCTGLSLYAILWGITPVELSQLPLILGAAALAWVVGYLSFFTPSGLGVREALLVALLAQIYSLPEAIVASLLFRLVSTLGELLAVLLIWIYDRLVQRGLNTTRV